MSAVTHCRDISVITNNIETGFMNVVGNERNNKKKTQHISFRLKNLSFLITQLIFFVLFFFFNQQQVLVLFYNAHWKSYKKKCYFWVTLIFYNLKKGAVDIHLSMKVNSHWLEMTAINFPEILQNIYVVKKVRYFLGKYVNQVFNKRFIVCFFFNDVLYTI